MWRRLVLHSHLKKVATSTSRPSVPASAPSLADRCLTSPRTSAASLFANRGFSVWTIQDRIRKVAGLKDKDKKLEDLLKQTEDWLKARNALDDTDFPVGPFGTKEAPAVVKCYYNERVVICPGEREDWHGHVGYIMLLLEKDKPN